MGTWGYKTFENDGAADWLYDLEEADGAEFLMEPVRAIARAKGKADLDDCLETLAAAEVMAASRHEPPKDAPRIARSWIKRTAFVATDADLKLAIRAVEKLSKNSELKETWEEEGKLAPWLKEVKQLSQRLEKALRAPAPKREVKVRKRLGTLAELIISVASGKESGRRAELQQKLAQLVNPNEPVAGTDPISGKKLDRHSPLHWVASCGLVTEAKLLLERGATVDVTVSCLTTPIDFAIENNHLEMVALLLEAGANRQNALFTALSKDRLEIIKLIAEGDMDLEAERCNGWNPILAAVFYGSMKSVEFFLERGVDVNYVNKKGNTPLHIAADESHFEAVKLLVAHGAKLNAVNSEGKTPLDLARQAKASAIVRFLEKQGATKGKDK